MLRKKEIFDRNTAFPEVFNKHRQLKIRNHWYRLRSQPVVDNKPSEATYGYEVVGNILAEYKKGATGTVLFMKNDENDAFWYFVRMDPEQSFENSVFEPGGNSDKSAHIYGWLRGDYVTLLE